MSAYIIVNIHITDPVKYEEYKSQAAPTVHDYGGKYIVRGGAAETLEGGGNLGRVVVLEFPSVEQAKAWWSSPEYAPFKKIRQASSTAEMIVVQGI